MEMPHKKKRNTIRKMNKKVQLIICNKKNAIKSATKNIHTVRSAAQIPYTYRSHSKKYA